MQFDGGNYKELIDFIKMNTDSGTGGDCKKHQFALDFLIVDNEVFAMILCIGEMELQIDRDNWMISGKNIDGSNFFHVMTPKEFKDNARIHIT